MKKKLFKATPIFFKEMKLRIDHAKGIIHDVVIAQHGVDKTGDYFDEVFLKSLVEQGNAQPMGLKSRFGHPNMCKEALGTYIGRFKNFRMSENSEKRMVAIADLHLDDVAKSSPNGNLYNYVLDMAAKNHDMFGNSIVFFPNESETVKETNTAGEEEEFQALRLKTFAASDMVDSPAATENLFKDTDGDFAAKATEFLDENPELFELIEAHPEIIKSFFDKYQLYKSQKDTMKKQKKSVLEILKGIVSSKVEKKSITATTDDGKKVNVVTDAEKPVAGDKVENEDGTPAGDGKYNLDGGKETVNVAGGAVTSVDAVETEEEEVVSEDQKEIVELVTTLKTSNDDLTKKNADLDKKVKDQDKSIADLKKEIEEVKKSIKTNYVPKSKATFSEEKKEKKDGEEKPKSVAEKAAAISK